MLNNETRKISNLKIYLCKNKTAIKKIKIKINSNEQVILYKTNSNKKNMNQIEEVLRFWKWNMKFEVKREKKNTANTKPHTFGPHMSSHNNRGSAAEITMPFFLIMYLFFKLLNNSKCTSKYCLVLLVPLGFLWIYKQRNLKTQQGSSHVYLGRLEPDVLLHTMRSAIKERLAWIHVQCMHKKSTQLVHG